MRDRIGCKVRSIELNLMQRCAAHLASATDLEGVPYARHESLPVCTGKTGRDRWHRSEESPRILTAWEYTSVPVSEVANKEEKCRFPGLQKMVMM